MVHADTIQQAIELLQNASRVLVVTGAGVSHGSGLPTYRGIGGLYTNRTLLPPEFTMSKFCFNWMPSLTWSKFHEAFDRSVGVGINAAHEAIADMNALANVTVLTQNVDGLHQEAGSKDVIEIHGNVRNFSCSAMCGFTMTVQPKSENRLPRCPVCGSVIRPDVILFGEALPSKATQRLAEVLHDEIDLIFLIGTTAVFPYIRKACLFNMAPIVSIDPKQSDFAKMYAKVQIDLPAEDVLPHIVNQTWTRTSLNSTSSLAQSA